MSFEYNASSKPVEIWTLDGNSTVVMLIRYPKSLGDLTDTFIKQFAEQYRRFKVQRQEVKLILGDQDRVGESLTVEMLDEATLRQTVYGLKGKSYHYALILQDTLQDDGSHNTEYVSLVEELSKSFRLDQ